MEKKAVLKVPNGKLLKITADLDDAVLVSIQITGDFFVYPEESISQLEQLLRYQPIEKELLLYMIDAFFKQNNVELFGITAEAIADAIMRCAVDVKHGDKNE